MYFLVFVHAPDLRSKKPRPLSWERVRALEQHEVEMSILVRNFLCHAHYMPNNSLLTTGEEKEE